MKIKVWEITNRDSKWYVLYDMPNKHLYGIYNNGCEVVELPNGYELEMSQCGVPYIYKNGFAYSIQKDKTGYFLYPAALTIHEAYVQNKIVYI